MSTELVHRLPAVGEISALQERLQSCDTQVSSLQQELSLLQLHVRDAQRAQGAAAEAQAAASKALDQQECELAALRQQLKEAQVGVQAACGMLTTAAGSSQCDAEQGWSKVRQQPHDAKQAHFCWAVVVLLVAACAGAVAG